MSYRTLARYLLPAFILCVGYQSSRGQDARTCITRLCSERMHGRGFALKGDQRAARYVVRESQVAGIKPFGKNYRQPFRINANTFPGRMKIKINGNTLVPGKDYIVDPASPGLKGNFIPAGSNVQVTPGRREIMLKKSGRRGSEGESGRIEITADKLNFGTSPHVSGIPHIIISEKACPDSIAIIRTNFRNRLLTGYQTQNIAGYVRGTVCPDSFVVFTAHYDHLGMMGKRTFFPGANDNASGVAMLLELSRYFSAHPQRFSVAFIFFSAEELGLQGSEYFVHNPLFPLKSVKFLINLDIVGTGINGITVVNATEFPMRFNHLVTINANAKHVAEIKKRGTACNSDHCPFFRNGTPCFFIYTLGGIAAYHDIYDRPETLPLTAFEGLTRLLIGFAGSF